MTYGSQRSSIKLSQVLCQLLKQQSAPDVDKEFIIENYKIKGCMALLKKVTESIIKGPCGKLTWLIKYTTGETKELIKHCIGKSGNIEYKNAIKVCKKVWEPANFISIL